MTSRCCTPPSFSTTPCGHYIAARPARSLEGPSFLLHRRQTSTTQRAVPRQTPNAYLSCTPPAYPYPSTASPSPPPTMSQTGVYISGDFSSPMSAQHNFANQFDLDHPEQAVSSYARIMHEHTKRQLQIATKSARRRSEASSSESGASLRSCESVTSNAS